MIGWCIAYLIRCRLSIPARKLRRKSTFQGSAKSSAHAGLHVRSEVVSATATRVQLSRRKIEYLDAAVNELKQNITTRSQNRGMGFLQEFSQFDLTLPKVALRLDR